MAKDFSRFINFPYRPCGSDGKRITAGRANIELCRRAAAEGMVLLENRDNALPLRQGEAVALFGNGSVDYVKGGGGSGIVYAPYVRNFYEGLRIKEAEGKIRLFHPLSDYYEDYLRSAPEREENPYQDFVPLPEAPIPEALFLRACQSCKTAVVVFSRITEEGKDHTCTPGDLLLSEKEQGLLRQVCAGFEKTVVLINAGTPIQPDGLCNEPGVKAVLLTYLAGMEGGLAAADILCGDVNPSGRLADTIPWRLEDSPAYSSFWASEEHVSYEEDIYVGYRYFETIPGAQKLVAYPFGYGLSYTSFEIEAAAAGYDGEKVVLTAAVRNTGTVSGRQVVQFYCSAPQGRLGKPARVLVGFVKTGVLRPGRSETVAVSVPEALFASFDDRGEICRSAFVLEKGKYQFYVGDSVRNAVPFAFALDLAEDRVLQKCHTYCAPGNLDRVLCADGSHIKPALRADKPAICRHAVPLAKAPEKEQPFSQITKTCSAEDFIAQLTEEELIAQVSGQPDVDISDTGCFGGLARLQWPRIPCSDGPAGLRTKPQCEIKTTAWPCEALLASTWDCALIEKIGEAGAGEFRENNIGIWLAPGMNIHRSACCGRNFEYYSEDPLLTGRMAAAMVDGIQSQKVAATVKHFACNNKETNRKFADARVSERALREIYLRGFELCIREAAPWIVMTAYNPINGVHCSEKAALLEGILRGEWGFDGLVTTDWLTIPLHNRELSAGNDIKMPHGDAAALRAALKSGEITRADLERSALRVLKMVLKLG